MKKKWGIVLAAVIFLVLAAGIIYTNIAKPKQEEDSNLKIVTTFYPMYIMAQNIVQGAQNVELSNMADVNVGCLHDYTLVAADMKKIENADVIVQNGLGLESFMDKILNTYSDIKVIDSSKNITNKIEENDGINPHIWTSIENYTLQVEEIANKLSEINPENKSVYIANKDNYVKMLKELQTEYSKELLNLEGKKAICLNEALTYIAKEVGLDVISVETDHEESSLSAENVKSLIDKMKNENINIILVDSEDNLKSAQTLANETNSKIYKLKSGLMGNLDKNSYIGQMEENLEQFKKMK